MHPQVKDAPKLWYLHCVIQYLGNTILHQMCVCASTCEGLTTQVNHAQRWAVAHLQDADRNARLLMPQDQDNVLGPLERWQRRRLGCLHAGKLRQHQSD